MSQSENRIPCANRGSRALSLLDGGDRLASAPASTLALSRSGVMGHRGRGGRTSECDERPLALPLLVLGVSMAGALAFAYCHPKGQEWRKRVFGASGSTPAAPPAPDAAPLAPAAATSEKHAAPAPSPAPTTFAMQNSSKEAEAEMRRRANDRALTNLGVRELNLGNLPEGAKIVNLPNQVGGHKMMKAMPALLLLNWEGKGPRGGSRRFVLKILHDGGRGLVELGFYENLAAHVDGPGARGEEPDRTNLVNFLCPYFGAVRVSTDAHTDESGDTVKGTCMYFLVLQDMCDGLDNACALDVKMGRTTVEPGEREEKRIGQLKKYPFQPIVGFRYVGMSWSSFFEAGQQPLKLSMGKDWGAKMTVEETGKGLAKFFHDGTCLRRGRVMCTLRKIRAIADFFTTQKIFRFYASSLLLTYDAADPAPEGDVEEEVEVRMIDFAHAVPVDGDGELGEGPAEAPGDKGYLYGAKNLLAIMEELLEVTAAPDRPVELEEIISKLTYMGKVKAGYSPV